MKAVIATALFALLGSSVAAPSGLRFAKRQGVASSGDPSTEAVETAINNWNNDVGNVNAFLNEAPSQNPEDLLNAAEEALINANDEPVELGVLASISDFSGDADYVNAVDDLQNIFGQVPLNLQDIINNPGDSAAVTQALNNINAFRCCNVLPDLDVLWLDAAEDYGLVGTVNTVVPRPNACASIICS